MMLTQVFYSRLNGKCTWSTTYSDRLYRTNTRAHLNSCTKPTKRQLRKLAKQSRLKR